LLLSQSSCWSGPRSLRVSKSGILFLSHTPASCHYLRCSQQVIPEPQPIFWGNISQGMPLLSTKIMPATVARLSMRGLQHLGGASSSRPTPATPATRALAPSPRYPPRRCGCRHSARSGSRWTTYLAESLHLGCGLRAIGYLRVGAGSAVQRVVAVHAVLGVERVVSAAA
jgi:hypothetical protein